MASKRTTKSIASRIQMNYLTQFEAMRYWKRVLMAVFAGGGLVWFLIDAGIQDNRAQMPGPLTGGHQFLQENCASCHQKGFQEVTNASCLNCDLDHAHHPQVAHEVSCVSCHAEHRHSDLVQTTQMDDCAQCHATLTRKDGQTPEVKVDIDTFHKGHPDFGYEVKPQSVKPVALKLNHQIHMKPGIAGPDGTVDLRCQSCHEVDAKKDGAGRYWNAPVSFEKHCQSCHQLEFDTDFPGQPAPHEKPEAVRSFVSTFYQERSADLASGLIGEKRRRTGPSGLKAEEKWKNSSNPQERLRGAERELFGRVCLECHTWDYQEGALPEVPPVEWFTSFIKKESFHHAAHRPLTCTSCHVTATKSEKTSDLLLPSMQVCQSCHQSEGLSTDQCQKCHVYHHVNPSLTDGGKVLEKFDEGSIEWKD